MADERYSISLGLDTSGARADLTAFEKEYASRVKSMGERLATVRPVIFADEAKGADKVVKQILTVRKSMADLKKEKRELGKIMSTEWENMSPDLKKSRGAAMKTLKDNIAKTDKRGKQLAAELKAIQDEPVRLLDGFASQLAMIRSKINSSAPSLEQTTILSEAKKLSEAINGKFKDLGSVRRGIEKIKVESREAWMAGKGPKNAETRKQHVIAMRTKQQPLIEQERELQQQISSMTNQKNDLVRSFSKASSKQYKELVQFGKEIEVKIADVKKYRDYLDVLLEGADLPLNSPKTRYKPQSRGVKISERMPEFDPYEALGGRRKRRGLARQLVEETPAQGRRNNNVTGGRAPNLILAALVKTGAITAEQAAKTAQGLGGVGVQLASTEDALAEFEVSLREANKATDEEKKLGEDEAVGKKPNNAKTLAQKAAEREILGPGLGEITTETSDFKRSVAEYNSYIASMAKAFSIGDESRANGINDRNSGIYTISPSNNTDNIEDDAESATAIITAKQFEEAAMITFEAAMMQNEAATSLGQGIIPVLINRTKKNQFLSPFNDDSVDEEGNAVRRTDAWQKVDFSNRDAIKAAYDKYVAEFEAKGTPAIEPYQGQGNSIAGLMGNGNTANGIELMIAAITKGARQAEFAPNAGEPGIGELINPGSLIAMEIFDQLPQLGKDFVELAHEIALTLGIIKTPDKEIYSEEVPMGMGNYANPAMTTFERMFDANNYNPRKKLDVNGQAVELGNGPGKLPPMEQVGVKSATITTIIQDLADEFKKIYGGTIAQLGNKVGKFDPNTFVPAKDGQKNAVEMKTIDAFIENRKAFIDFVKYSRTTVSDITMALPHIENAFNKLSMVMDEGVAGSTLPRGEIKDQSFAYRQGQNLGLLKSANKNFRPKTGDLTPQFSDAVDSDAVIADIATGLQQGVSAKEGQIAQAGADMGQALGDGFDNQIGRHSPARYFIEAADDAAEGVIVGSQKRLKDLSDAGRQLAESFSSGYSDQAKVNAIAKIQELENAGLTKQAEALKKSMRQSPASDKNPGATFDSGYVLASTDEVIKRNAEALKLIEQVTAKYDDALVAFDIESTGGRGQGNVDKQGKLLPAVRNRVFGYSMVAGAGVKDQQAGPVGTVVTPNMTGISHGMLVPPKDSGQLFNAEAAKAVGLQGADGTNIQVLPNLLKRIESLGYGPEKQTGSEQEYVNQLQDIAVILTKLYESGTPLAIHNQGLSDLVTLGKELAHYQIAAPTASQFKDSGLLVETQRLGKTLGAFMEKQDGSGKMAGKVGDQYQLLTGKQMGAQLIPEAGNKPVHQNKTAVAHDPTIDSAATLVNAATMRQAGGAAGVKQIGLLGKIIEYATSTWSDISDAIWGAQKFGIGTTARGKTAEPGKMFNTQTATHDPSKAQPAVPTRGQRTTTLPASSQATLFDDAEIQAMQDDAQKRRAYEEELAKLYEAREQEKERLRKERIGLERQYKVDMVEQLMSENKAIGFNNVTNNVIPGKTIKDQDKARLQKNNDSIAKALEDSNIADGIRRQLGANGGVRSFFTAPVVKASRELADQIQDAIDKAKRAINKMDEDAGTRTPATRGSRNGGGKPPRKSGIPGGGYSDEPTPEYKALVTDSTNPGNQDAVYFDTRIEQHRLEQKSFASSQKAMDKAVQAHEKVVADANRKMVDSWISTRYSLYDVASTYEDMGNKLRMLTSYIREAVMVNSAYETSFTSVERVMQPLSDEVDGMRQRLVLMTQELPVAFDQLAKIATLGGQMGINADGINNFTEQVVKYSSITGMSADTVAEKFGRISQLADIPADDFNKLASAVAYAGINAVATDQEIITLTESIAAATNLAGFGADETVGLATAISSLGIAPEQARGVIVRLFGDIERGMQTGGKELDAYSKHLGMSAKETKELWNTDPQAFFKRMLENLSKAGSMTTALDNLNIVETREVNTLQRLAKNMDVYNQSMGDAQESYANGTFLGEAYAKTQDNVAAKLEILNNQMKILQDNFGEAFNPLLKPLLDLMIGTMDWINKITASPIGKVVTGLVAGITALVAGFVAYQVASYKATAATLAMKTAMVQLGKMGGEKTGIKGLVDVLTGQERMIIDSNGRLRSITKERLDEMKELGKIVPEGSAVDRALKAGVDVRKAATPGSMDAEIATKNGMTLGPLSENEGALLPNLATQSPSVAQMQEQILVNKQLIQIRRELSEASLESSGKLRIYALAQGDAAAAEKAAAQSAASTRELNRLDNMEEGLDKNLASLNTPAITPQDVVSPEVATNVEQSTASLNEMGAGLDSVATEADKGSVATTRFGKAVGFAVKAAGAIGLILTLVATASEIYKSFQIDLLEAGGGLDSFREAIYKDTAAWKENGETIGLAQSKVTESKAGLTTWAQSMEATTGSSAKMTTAITETTDSITEQTLALGANSMEWLAQAAMADDNIQKMFKSYFDKGKDLDKLAKKANISIQDMLGMALKNPGKGAEEYLRGWFTNSAELQAQAPGLYSDLQSIAFALDGTTKSGIENSKIMKALGGAFGEADDGAGDLNNELDNTIARVYTLTDYVGDLSSILSAAFTIRYGKEEATDALASSWENVKNRIDDAREAIEKIKDEIKSMTADRNILEYQLNIALKYGDSMRADKLRAELEAKDKELADKSKELGTAQDGASTSLVGNTKAAADNRAVMRGLIQDYNKYLESLANTNLSQKELKKRASQAKADMLAQGQALGFSAEEMAPYAKSFKDFRTIVDKLPKELTLRVDADPGTRAFMEFWAKQNSGGGSKSKSSSSTGSGSTSPSGKPNAPIWNGPSTSSRGAQTARPESLHTFDMALEIAGDTIEDYFAKMFGGGFLDVFTNPGDATSGGKWYKKSSADYRDVEARDKEIQAWDAAEANGGNAILRSGMSKEKRAKLGKEHAQKFPGQWNPFTESLNPGEMVDSKGNKVLGAGVMLPTARRTDANAKWVKDQAKGDLLTSQYTAKDKWSAFGKAKDQKAQTDSVMQTMSMFGTNTKGNLKKFAAEHAKSYPGEYNPFNQQQNPWPASQKLLQDKGVKTLKSKAEIHAALHPGEYNPYSSSINPMGPVDKKLAAALKDRKTRKAMGEEHARLYPGEYNPYTEEVNPKKKSVTDIAKGGKSAGQLFRESERADAKAAAIQAATDSKIPGNTKSKPLYVQIVGGAYMGGPVNGYASGGLIPGKSPSNPSVDNLVAAGPSGMIGIRSGEFIQSQPAVNYYGLDFMNAINNLQIPRYASGGMIGAVAGGGGTNVVELSPSAVMQIMAIANRPVNLYSDDRQIASSANRGNMLLAMRGSN